MLDGVGLGGELCEVGDRCVESGVWSVLVAGEGRERWMVMG